MNLPTLVNVRSGAEFDVYIGRPSFRAKDERCRVGSIWGNPFVGERDKAVRDYRMRHIRLLLLAGGPVPFWCEDVYGNDHKSAAWWGEQLDLLRGKRLGCWCSPEPCHGDAIIEAVKRRMEGEAK